MSVVSKVYFDGQDVLISSVQRLDVLFHVLLFILIIGGAISWLKTFGR